MIIQGLTDGFLTAEKVVAVFLHVSLFPILLVGISSV
jgi:hypothetical protein